MTLACKVDETVRIVKEALASGHAVVIGLQSTGRVPDRRSLLAHHFFCLILSLFLNPCSLRELIPAASQNRNIRREAGTDREIERNGGADLCAGPALLVLTRR